MKNITTLLMAITISLSYSQTTIWSSDSEDYLLFAADDADDDGFGWGVYTEGLEDYGFEPGPVFFSESYDLSTNTALSPDNLLFTPEGVISIPADAQSINFGLKVAAVDAAFPAETFAIYVYDEAVGPSFDDKIFETTLAVGGFDSAMDITADIPISFAGKDISIIVRHYMTTDQNQLLVDDFLVTYSNVLSIDEATFNDISIYPNPVKNILKFKSSRNIKSATFFNQLGQKILTLKESELVANQINVAQLNPGIYILKITNGERSQAIKLIKE